NALCGKGGRQFEAKPVEQHRLADAVKGPGAARCVDVGAELAPQDVFDPVRPGKLQKRRTARFPHDGNGGRRIGKPGQQEDRIAAHARPGSCGPSRAAKLATVSSEAVASAVNCLPSLSSKAMMMLMWAMLSHCGSEPTG